jgi:hypothetical protein
VAGNGKVWGHLVPEKLKRTTFMQIIQILLPVTDRAGERFSRELYHEVKDELTARFKGLTVYSRAPAEGIWKPRKGTKRDDIVVYEVMARKLDRKWWRNYGRRLEQLFQQESVVIRAQRMTML